MITKGCLLVCLAVLFCTEISAQDCSKFRERLHEANKGNLKLLRSKMSLIVHLQCMEDGTEFLPSEDMLRSIDMSLEENAKVVIEEILQQTSLIFRQNYTKSAWDETSMDVFQKRLDEQMKDLKTCLNAERQTGIKSPRLQQFQLTRLRVKTHFQRIQAFLREEQYSQCAWESVQTEAHQCFLLINQLIHRIQQ
ncbi:interferon alpha-5-like [Tiliqua scincoides]|uniref:interferon alpha-5-like n=1 Tax=Tiliqua scincoides TaxID=71010 RepID=UPI003462C1FD